MNSSIINAYWHTIQNQKFIQLWGRVTLSIKLKFFHQAIKWYVHTRTHTTMPKRIPLKKKPYIDEKHNIQKNRFTFLDQTKNFQNKIEWNTSTSEKLWLYHLHYFNYLLPLTYSISQLNYETGKSIITNWIENNPTGFGNGWEPYPLSLRVVNWIFYFNSYFNYFKNDEPFCNKFLKSLFQQSTYLTFILETHLLANHYLANSKALIWAGIFFNKNSWIHKGRKIFEHELKEQVLNDGGHFERSPMYHAFVLIDVIDILNILKNSHIANEKYFDDALLLSKIEKMLTWMELLKHPDGDIALFGDSALSTVPSYEKIKEYYRQVIDPVQEESHTSDRNNYNKSLIDSGYYIIKTQNQYMAIDGGELGVPYNPGHAHCDLLSYEYSYHKHRFIVDSGIANYMDTPHREKARSIYSHNTVVVNKMEQAQLWKIFRMGKRVRNPQIYFNKTDEGWLFRGSYDNNIDKYNKYTHHREIFFNQESFKITDTVKGSNITSIENLIHIHPGCEITLDQNRIILTRNQSTINILIDLNSTSIKIKEWFYYPTFNKKIPNKMVVIKPNDLMNNQTSYFINYSRTYDI